uniref:hypothetical protein n=1 Tax=Thaumasiovibrio occultus TaxID=1891184 RepID=UPI000B3525A6|nr:hypothetical protein [Thaumasiovibrio occultus]
MDSISKQIREFAPDQGNWLGLDALLQRIEAMDQDTIAACLNVFERFPDDDGAGVFFTIIHCLEHFGNYAAALVTSVEQSPNHWNLLMLNRMLNADIYTVGNTDILQLLTAVHENTAVSQTLRDLAYEFLMSH